MRKLRLAFIGGGINSAVGHAHFSALQMDGKFELVSGFFSRDKEINRASAEFYKCALNEDLQVDYDLDAVVVLTPTPTHFEIVKECINNHALPVICEKAFTSTFEDGDELIRLKNDIDGFIAVTYNYTGYPMIRELQHMVRVGGLGRILSIQIEMPQEGYLRENAKVQEWRLTDGVIPSVHLDLGTHLHNLIYFITGDHPINLASTMHRYSDFGVVDDVNCLAEYSTGFSVNMYFGKTAIGHRNGLRIRINGSHASAEWVQTNPEELQIATCKGQRGTLDRSSPECFIASQARYQRFKVGHPAGFIEAYANLYSDLADALVQGIPLDHLSAEVAVDGLEMMNLMVNSAGNV